MKDFLESDLKKWDNPLSTSEDRSCLNALSVITGHIKNSNLFRDKDIEVFIQGSYANDTNVRQNSDIDICVMLKDTFRGNYPQGKTKKDYGYVDSTYTFEKYRSDVTEILVNNLGMDQINVGSKAIRVKNNTYRNFADVIPCFEYRIHNNYEHIDSGVTFDSTENITYYNYPKQHTIAGKNKNNETNFWYKKIVRNIKSIMYTYQDSSKHLNIKSFVLEGILFNIPNVYYKPEYLHNWEISEHQGPHTYVFERIVKLALQSLNSPLDLLEPNKIQKLFEGHPTRVPNHYKQFFEAILRDYLE